MRLQGSGDDVILQCLATSNDETWFIIDFVCSMFFLPKQYFFLVGFQFIGV